MSAAYIHKWTKWSLNGVVGLLAVLKHPEKDLQQIGLIPDSFQRDVVPRLPLCAPTYHNENPATK